MCEFCGKIGRHVMPRVQIPAVTPKRRAWNKDRITAQNRPLLPKQVWAIHARLELETNLRGFALYNVAIHSKLRGCYVVKLVVPDLMREGLRSRCSGGSDRARQPPFPVSCNIEGAVGCAGPASRHRLLVLLSESKPSNELTGGYPTLEASGSLPAPGAATKAAPAVTCSALTARGHSLRR